MYIQTWNSIFSWVAIVSIVLSLVVVIWAKTLEPKPIIGWVVIIAVSLSLLATIGTLATGKIIERERLNTISQLQPRHLSEKQRTQLIVSLAGLKGQSVIFVSRFRDDESFDYAQELEEVFRQAGLNVGQMNSTLLEDFPGFLTGAVSEKFEGDVQSIETVRMAFLKAGIDFRFVDFNRNQIGGELPPDTIFVFVGRKGIVKEPG